MLPKSSLVSSGFRSTEPVDKTTDTNSGGSTASSGGGYAEFRQATADSGLHDEGYAGATNTDTSDADAVVDEVNEAKEIVKTTTNTAKEVANTFKNTQPSPAENNVSPSTDVTGSNQKTNQGNKNQYHTMDTGTKMTGWISNLKSKLSGIIPSGIPSGKMGIAWIVAGFVGLTAFLSTFKVGEN